MVNNRPSIEHIMMDMAELISKRSTCNRLKVGCIIANEDLTSINSMGYNGNAKGLNNCCDTNEPGNCGCIHSELNAIIKTDYSLKDKRLFTTHSPCKNCAKIIINAGIKYVYYRTEYRDTLPLELLKQANIEVKQI